MSKRMRAKMRIGNVQKHNDECEQLTLHGVSKDGPYPSDGSDEDNTFAKFSPSVTLDISIMNPALLGAFKTGDTFYVDFTPIEV